MIIYDSQDQTIAIVNYFKDITLEKKFLSENNLEMQFATFSMEKNSAIKRHKHNKQERKIFNTSEGIVVLEGKIEILLYDSNTEALINQITLNNGDSILMYQGGHEIKILEDTKFIEFKQGPYIENLDKKLF